MNPGPSGSRVCPQDHMLGALCQCSGKVPGILLSLGQNNSPTCCWPTVALALRGNCHSSRLIHLPGLQIRVWVSLHLSENLDMCPHSLASVVAGQHEARKIPGQVAWETEARTSNKAKHLAACSQLVSCKNLSSPTKDT